VPDEVAFHTRWILVDREIRVALAPKVDGPPLWEDRLELVDAVGVPYEHDPSIHFKLIRIEI
jgi:hypothetical protein